MLSKLLRHWEIGDTVFVTTITGHRDPILLNHFDILRQSVDQAITKLNFEEIAWVVMPDHYHALIRVSGCDTSKVMQSIKMSFSSLFRKAVGLHSGHIWQRRYWDHVIRDSTDFERHLDYIHHNPVGHGLASRSREYRYSSFDWFVENGYYERNWLLRDEDIPGGEFGE
jgi:putative transposase